MAKKFETFLPTKDKGYQVFGFSRFKKLPGSPLEMLYHREKLIL
jgi:hypothetical protein